MVMRLYACHRLILVAVVLLNCWINCLVTQWFMRLAGWKTAVMWYIFYKSTIFAISCVVMCVFLYDHDDDFVYR